MLWLWLFISGLILVIISLFIKIHLLRKSAKEIECSFSERLLTDSNTLIDISSNDKRMRHLANEIIYVFLTIFLYLPKCPQSLILSALRAFCFCGKPRISRSIFLYFPCQSWLKSW